MVKITTLYKGSLRCESTHGPSNKLLITDAPRDNLGKGESFSPTDLLATGLATCMATLMGITAQKKGWDLKDLKIEIEKKMVADPHRRISALPAVITLAGDWSEPQKSALREAAEGCPVRISLDPRIDTSITWNFIG